MKVAGVNRSPRVVLVALLIAAQVAFAGVAALSRAKAQRDFDGEAAATAAYHAQFPVAKKPRGVTREAPTFRLADGPDAAATLRIVESCAAAAGVTILSIEAPPSCIEGRQAFVVSGQASPEGVCRFVAALEREPRLIVVENGRLEPAATNEVRFEFGLATWHHGVER